uniref:Bromo domain-containing protein n=1 Tax=Anguilla anguilla TaxID=7936 RepID=A0A0E9WYK0_ANGAN
MWLDKVAEKLQDRQYSSVGQFVSDIHLIFENCATFNRDNEFGQTGARLRQLFDEEFQHVFSVKN